MDDSAAFFQTLVEQIELPTWLANRFGTKNDLFTCIFEASAQDRYDLYAYWPLEVMAILKWEAMLEQRDRVGAELFGFLYCLDNEHASAASREVQLLQAIEQWNRIHDTRACPFSVWQAYLKTWAEMTHQTYSMARIKGE